MDHQPIIDTLSNLAHELETKIKYPNSGGCGIIALEVASYLDRHYDCAIKVINSESENSPVKSLTQVFKYSPYMMVEGDTEVWHDEYDIWFSHIVLQLKFGKKKYIFDTNGVHPKKQYNKEFNHYGTIMRGRMPLETMMRLNDNKDNWNSRFNRRQIPKIRRIVRAHLGHLE